MMWELQIYARTEAIRPSFSFRRLPLRFSLGSALVAFTAISLGLGWYAQRIHQQRELIASLGGRPFADRVLIYDYQWEYCSHSQLSREPPESPTESYPRWLVDLIGEDAFVTVFGISLDFLEVPANDQVIDAICRVRTLRSIQFGEAKLTIAQRARILQAHPRIDVRHGNIAIEESTLE